MESFGIKRGPKPKQMFREKKMYIHSKSMQVPDGKVLSPVNKYIIL